MGFEATYYNWRNKHEGKSASDVRKLRNLKEENRMLKKIVADKELGIDAFRFRALLEEYGDAR